MKRGARGDPTQQNVHPTPTTQRPHDPGAGGRGIPVERRLGWGPGALSCSPAYSHPHAASWGPLEPPSTTQGLGDLVPLGTISREEGSWQAQEVQEVTPAATRPKLVCMGLGHSGLLPVVSPLWPNVEVPEVWPLGCSCRHPLRRCGVRRRRDGRARPWVRADASGTSYLWVSARPAITASAQYFILVAPAREQSCRRL